MKFRFYDNPFHNIAFRLKLARIRKRLSEDFPDSQEAINSIVPKTNIVTIGVFRAMMLLWEKICFGSVDADITYQSAPGFEAQKIIVGSHVSHFDYTLGPPLLIKHGVIDTYTVNLASDHLDFFPYNVLLSGANGCFIKRDKRMTATDKALLKAFFNQLRQEQIPIFFYPEGGTSVIGSTKALKLGVLSFLRNDAATRYEIIPIKIIYNRMVDDNSFLRVRREGAWPSEQRDTAGKFASSLSRVLSWRGRVKFLVGRGIFSSLEDLGQTARLIGEQLNALYVFEDLEAIKLTLYTYSRRQESILLEEVIAKTNALLPSRRALSVDAATLEQMAIFGDVDGSVLRFRKETPDVLFHHVNQYILAFIFHAARASGFHIDDDTRELLGLNPAHVRDFGIAPEAEVMRLFPIELHLNEMLRCREL